MIEDDDMRAVFFDPADFGEEVTFTPQAPAEPFTCFAIFDARPVAPRAIKGAQVGFDDGANITGNSPMLRCRTSDIDGKVKAARAQVTVRGKAYNVFDVKPDSTGVSVVILKVA